MHIVSVESHQIKSQPKKKQARRRRVVRAERVDGSPDLHEEGFAIRKVSAQLLKNSLGLKFP